MSKKDEPVKPETAAAAQGSAVPAPAPKPASAPGANGEVRSLADIPWEQLDDPTPVVKAPELWVKMGHSFDSRVLSNTMTAWRAKDGLATLDSVDYHPFPELGVLILSPRNNGNGRSIRVRPDGGAANIRLRDALEDFDLTWPRDQNLAFPALVKKTRWGWSLVLHVAGRKYEDIVHRDDKNKQEKNPKQ